MSRKHFLMGIEENSLLQSTGIPVAPLVQEEGMHSELVHSSVFH